MKFNGDEKMVCDGFVMCNDDGNIIYNYNYIYIYMDTDTYIIDSGFSSFSQRSECD